jgi:hypothetical protein
MPDAPHPTRLHVTAGAPRVNCAVVTCRSETVALIEIDMGSKRCVVDTVGGDPPFVGIGATRGSLHLEKCTPRHAATLVEFPDFAGWQVWSAEASRYTVRVTLRHPGAKE